MLASLIVRASNGKRICSKKFHKISDSDSFFQRVDSASAEKCLERCIDQIEHCKAAVFTQDRKKLNGLCQLYAVNSQSNDVKVVIDGTLNPISTVYELADKCAVSLSNNKDDIATRIDPELRYKLENWSDDENEDKILKIIATDTAEHRRKETESDSESHRTETDEGEMRTDHAKTKIAMSEFNGPRFITTDSSHEKESEVSRFRTFPKPPPTTHSREEDGYPTEPKLPSPNRWSSGVHDGVGTENVKPAPIHPVQLSRSGEPIPCADANCYAHALIVSSQMGYVNPCATLVNNPCASRLSNPCPSIPQLVPCASSISDKSPQSTESLSADVVWSEWSGLSTCSVTCGEGIAERRRFCSVEGHCPGASVREEPCEREPCAQWSLWGEWSECSQSCGGGEQKRRRICSSERQCDGPSQMARPCNEQPCVSAEWTPWSPWEPCSATCGTGKQERYRQCLDGPSCPGPSSEQRICEAGLCPSWAEWQPWSSCSKSCGTGHKLVNDSVKMEEDVKEMVKKEHSVINSHVLNGSHGPSGVYAVSRAVIPPQKFERGTAQDQAPCRSNQCPEWANWQDWSECSVTCGHGQQIRRRTCQPDGASCDGNEKEYRFCQDSACPYWDEWSAWSACSVTCGIGARERRRKCIKGDGSVLSNIDEIIADGTEEIDMKSAAKAKLIEINRNRQRNRDGAFTEEKDTSQIQFQTDLPADVLAVRVVYYHSGLRGLRAVHPVEEGIDQAQRLPSIGVQRVDEFRGRLNNRLPPPASGYAVPRDSAFSDDSSRFLRPKYQSRPIFADVRGLQPIIPVKHFSRPRRQASSRNQGNHYSYKSQCQCEGKLFEEGECNVEPCVPTPESQRSDCAWSEWGEWCGCSGPCNVAARIRSRYCDRASSLTSSTFDRRPSLPDKNCKCIGETSQFSQCPPTICSPSSFNRDPTPTSSNFYAAAASDIGSNLRDNRLSGCSWSEWNPWGACVGGIKTRTRSCVGTSAVAIRCQCVGPVISQSVCVSNSLRQKTSNDHSKAEPSSLSSFSTVPDPQDDRIALENRDRDYCSWEVWGPWSSCSVSCGRGGAKIRRRQCPCRHCNNGSSGTEVRDCDLPSCRPEEKLRKDPFD
ncbi:unnamed protein product [Anisakis simplex]|uniref:Properdin (inferred by orthology to a human protein) n=1 Tax=Anisakis simplex TaxID=6269 RepID=A0A0M3K200_ANISI|nr:unnamed protein product [Anisakis simplex]